MDFLELDVIYVETLAIKGKLATAAPSFMNYVYYLSHDRRDIANFSFSSRRIRVDCVYPFFAVSKELAEIILI